MPSLDSRILDCCVPLVHDFARYLSAVREREREREREKKKRNRTPAPAKKTRQTFKRGCDPMHRVRRLCDPPEREKRLAWKKKVTECVCVCVRVKILWPDCLMSQSNLDCLMSQSNGSNECGPYVVAC